MPTSFIHRLLLSTLFALAATLASAQTTTTYPTPAAADTSRLRAYTGTYAMSSADLKQVIITLEGGRLTGEAVGMGSSVLNADPANPDTFIVPDQNGGSDPYGTVRFGRDSGGTVTKIQVSLQGQTYDGVRTGK